MIVSPECSFTCGCSPCAIRRSADSGSPWLPVVSITSRSSGKLSISFGDTSRPSGTCGVAELARDVEVLAHRAADHGDPAVERDGGVDHLLEPVHVGRERGDHDRGPRRAPKTSSSTGPTLASDGAVPLPVGVGRVAAQQQHSLPPELGEARRVGRRPVHRRLVELVVAGDDHRAELAGQRRPRRRRGSSARRGSARARTGPASIALARARRRAIGTFLSLCSSIFERAIATVSGPP